MRVLVTGGAGFIGSHVAESLLAAGHEVAVLDNLSVGKRENVPLAAAFYDVDIRDADRVAGVFKDFAPDVVSHHAAQASVSASVRDPILDAEVNIRGSLNVMDAARRGGIRRFIFASTGGAIYGDVPEGRRAAVSWPPRPASPYAVAKVAIEHYLLAYGALYGLDYRILRYANVYGPRQDPNGEAGVVAIFVSRLLAGESVQINARQTAGDEGCIRDYVYVRDIARASVETLAGAGHPLILNVGTGTETSTLALARTIEELLRVKARMQFAPVRAGDVPRSVLDPADTERVLGRPTDLRQGLAETIEWYRRSAPAVR